MRRFANHFRIYLFRGLIALMPIALTVFAVRFLFVFVDRRVMNMIDEFIGFRFPGLGILLVIMLIYFIGLIASNFFGRWLFQNLENIMNKLPLIRITYNIGKQLGQTLTMPEGQVFKRAVLVEYLKPGMWTVGFVTGKIRDPLTPGEMLLKIFISTAPNPTTGMLVLVRENQVRDPGWSVQEALRIMISGGILGPEAIIEKSVRRSE